MRIILFILIYFFAMFSISVAVGIGVVTGLKNYFYDKLSKEDKNESI